MSLDGVTLIDSHIHIYPQREIGERLKGEYEILDYGEKAGVTFSPYGGDVEDAVAAIAAASFDRAAVLNIFEIQGWPGPPQATYWPKEPPLAEHREDLVESNVWTCGLASDHPELIPFISVHPGVMNDADLKLHVEEMFGSHGAAGIKIHPNSQRINPAAPRMWPVYELCVEAGAPIIAHSGVDKRGQGLANPSSFGPMLDAFPNLKLVLAHLGGGVWRDAAPFAEQYPVARFDLCEIIEWIDATDGPTEKELAQLIKSIGAERVLLGSDFPWYDLDRTMELVYGLPLLSTEEKEAIVGRNAQRLLELEL